MQDRTAIDTIKGYFYQFDHTIDRILKLENDDDTVQVEGIEDIDIQTATDASAIQCKYYAKTEYNHSVIAEPIRLMLDHFALLKKAGNASLKYILNGYFKSGQEKLILPVDVARLKAHFLTYKKEKVLHEHHAELHLSDAELKEFIGLLEINIHSKEFDKQFSEIVKQLKRIFACSEFTAEYFFYNNALRVIKELSKESNPKKRIISRKDFLKRINFSRILFNEWFIVLKGEKNLFKKLRAEYFTTLNISPFERFFLIEIDPANYVRADLKELIQIISRKWSKLSKREPKPFCPYLYVHGLPKDELIELKQEMWIEEFYTIDGFDYEGAAFNPHSIAKRPDYNNQIRLKLLNSTGYIDRAIAVIAKTKEIYQFYLKEPYYLPDLPHIKKVNFQVAKLTDIKQII